MSNKPEVRNKVFELKKKKTNVQGRLISSDGSFSIEETEVQVIFEERYIQYTFIVERDEEDSNILENYVCRVFDNGTIEQYLVTYPFSENETGIVYDHQNTFMQRITDLNLSVFSLGPNYPAGCVPELINIIAEYVCVSVPCSGGGHHVGENCDCGVAVDCTPAHMECSWQYTYVFSSCGGGPEESNPENPVNPGGHPPGGGTSGAPDFIDEDPIVTVPFENGRSKKKECNKIANFLDNNADFKTALGWLNSQLNNNHEISINKFENDSTIYQAMGIPNNPEVEMALTAPEKYEAFAHTHYEDPATPDGDTYSVFSLADLEAFAMVLEANKMNNNFVAFLSTGKGTYYALTIADKNKFLKFFEPVLHSLPVTNSLTELQEYSQSVAKYQNLKDKYFDETNAIIQKNNTNNEEVLSTFLQFLHEADMGINMFSSNANWDSFERVTYEPNFPNKTKSEPCNN